MFPGLVLFRRLKDERLGRVELRARVPGIPFARGRVDHPDGSACREIQFVEIHPDKERIEHRFVVVDAVFLVGDRAPARRRDVRFVGRADAQRHRDVADDAEDRRHGQPLLGGFGNRIYVERSPYETVGCPVGASISAIVINQFGMPMIIFISMITSLLCVIFCLLQTIQKQAAIITSENI